MPLSVWEASSGRPARPRRAPLAALLLLAATLPAFAQSEAAPGCPKEGVNPRDYLDCLNARQRLSEATLERAFTGSLAAIEARADLQPAQRKRWQNLLEEAQGRFIHWRNFECQSIAPYEGGGALQSVGGRLGGVGMLEQRLLCLTAHGEARARDLEARYAPPGGWPAPAPVPAAATPAPAAIETAPAPAAPTTPPRIIEMSP